MQSTRAGARKYRHGPSGLGEGGGGGRGVCPKGFWAGVGVGVGAMAVLGLIFNPIGVEVSLLREPPPGGPRPAAVHDPTTTLQGGGTARALKGDEVTDGGGFLDHAAGGQGEAQAKGRIHQVANFAARPDRRWSVRRGRRRGRARGDEGGEEGEGEEPGADAGTTWVEQLPRGAGARAVCERDAPPPRRRDNMKETLDVRPIAPQAKRVVDQYEQFYERASLHQKQRFLGVRFGQDPMDALVLQEVIFDVVPDVIIETGTNSGGSALYMAFLLEAINPAARVLTLDVSPLDKWHEKWGQGTDPRQWAYWKRRVTQHVGSSTSPETIAMVREFIGGAERVMVVLDSDHEYGHVAKETKLLCPFVTVGSYCVVEDTKFGGALRAAREWVGESQGAFVNDRRREYLLFTQHREGWLRRVR